MEFPDQIREALGSRAPQAVGEWVARPAGVLVPLYRKHGDWHLLFTLRTDTVAEHRSQISFPGGRRDPEDRDIVATALREAEEELGLRPEDVTVLGQLDELWTVTQYRITPTVGVFPYPYPLRPSPAEIAELIEVPLDALRNPSNLEIGERAVMLGAPIPLYYYHVGNHTIWGVTARIVRDFLERIDPNRKSSG